MSRPPGDSPLEPEVPVAVQARLVALAVPGLAAMPTSRVPPAVRTVAGFAPAKRSRLLAAPLLSALRTDEIFRSHLATQLRALQPDLAGAVDALDGEGGVDVAALAVVLRPEGWQQLVAEIIAAQRPGDDASVTTARLEAALDQARGELRATRDRMRAQLDQVKADNAQLRRTLGQTRVDLAAAVEQAEQARSDMLAATRREEQVARRFEADARRLKARIAELEGDNAAARRAARDDRQAEVMRLRLLLDTMSDAAAGLRRELALPPSEALPADTVDAVEPAVDTAVGVGRSMAEDDPALLRRLIEIPRVHLIVDGYNVSKGSWPSLPLDQQRARLVGGLSAVVAGKKMETTVVFDGADLAAAPPVPSARGVRVRFSPPGVIADDLIRQLVEAEPVGRPVVVVSSDREVARTVTKKGARAVAAEALARTLGA